MKTKTMKKALSFFLAVLMIALAIPFTLLTVSAEGTASAVKFKSVTLNAQDNGGNKFGFASANPGSIAINGILNDGEEALSGANPDLTFNTYFDENGKIAYKMGEGEYYGIIVVELEALTKLGTFTLWSPNTKGGNWFANEAYDIYYSVDGISFTAVDGAEFTDLNNKANATPGEHYVSAELSEFPGEAVGTIYRHDVDMKGVTAKYVAIAAKGTIAAGGNKQLILHEVTATGTVVDIPAETVKDVGMKAVKLYAQDNDGNKFGFASANPGSIAINGILNDGEEALSGAHPGLSLNTYFDENGNIAYKTGEGEYYGIIVVELEALTKLDTFTLWSPNTKGGNWFANEAYDIYYSVGGTSFTAVDGAEFTDLNNEANATPGEHYVSAELSEFPGEAVGTIYRHDVDMKGVTAKYVAIAAKGTIAAGGNKQLILHEVTAKGATPLMSLESGAAVRMDEPTGLRFTGYVNKGYVDALKTAYGEENVKLGMLITPTDYLEEIEFTKAALDAADIEGVKYLEIDATTILTDGNYYKINCAIVEILKANYNRDFSAILYVKVVSGQTATYTYSAYNENENSRNVAEVAELAFGDLADENGTVKNGLTYSNPVVVGDVTKYSPYTEEQRGTLANFFQ